MLVEHQEVPTTVVVVAAAVAAVTETGVVTARIHHDAAEEVVETSKATFYDYLFIPIHTFDEK